MCIRDRVCTGMPGALPVLNKQVVHYAAKMGKATGCTINQLCKACLLYTSRCV